MHDLISSFKQLSIENLSPEVVSEAVGSVDSRSPSTDGYDVTAAYTIRPLRAPIPSLISSRSNPSRSSLSICATPHVTSWSKEQQGLPYCGDGHDREIDAQCFKFACRTVSMLRKPSRRKLAAFALRRPISKPVSRRSCNFSVMTPPSRCHPLLSSTPTKFGTSVLLDSDCSNAPFGMSFQFDSVIS